ncbi:hypothetical protein L3X38_011455 [Prunus dulcis]|uniref:Integrase catalytic domain-containing protein n=1 Tax=Prunus dulcis TaxID=3755 RepID=A0AAD4WJ42_PRUDU|nr:hypothetical protein L3X38_011455 [Prunus dulcis]
MFNEEARRKEQGVAVESKALVSECRERSSNRKLHKREKSKIRSKDDSRGRSKTRRDLEYYHCGRIGHIKRECMLFKREKDRGNKRSDARDTTATTFGGNEVWAYALRTKDQVYEVFQWFYDSIERETGRSLKCIRTDNRGEYIRVFRNYCRSNGIRHERSVLKIPQHNGVAERMNKTIVERIRTSYLMPRAFFHIPKDEISKLDEKLKECIFMGYGNEEFSYRLWDPLARKIIISRDVVFFEDQNIEDMQRGDKPDNLREYPAKLDPISHPLQCNEGRDESNDTDDPTNDPITNEPVNDDMIDGHIADGVMDDVANEGQEAQAHESCQIPTKKIDKGTKTSE